MKKIFKKEDLKDSILSLYYNGKPEGYGIGLPELDEKIIWDTKRLSLVSGVPNMGKSEFVDFVCVQLNKLHGWKIAYFSPENYPIDIHLEKIISKVTNKEFDKNEVTEMELMQAIDYISNNFFFMDTDHVRTMDDILDSALELIHTEDIKVLVIDAFYNIDHSIPSNMTETVYIDNVLNKLQRFAKMNDILIHLVVHTRKMQAVNGVYPVPNFYDLNGSANFANRADYCTIVHRDFINDLTEIHIQKMKNKHFGSQGIAFLKYDNKSGNYYPEDPLPFFSPSLIEEKNENNENKTVEELRKETEERLKKELEKYKNKNVLNVDVTLYENHFDKIGKDINLYSFLKNGLTEMDFKYSKCKRFNDREIYKNLFEYIAQGDNNPNNYLKWIRTQPNYKEIKTVLPFNTASGTFKGGHGKKNLVKHNNLIGIDIDAKDNDNDMQIIYERLKKLKYVAYIGHSASGIGIYCIIPISEPDKHLEHFNSIEKEFKEMGIKIDTSCKDVSRIRFYCFDPDAYFNERAATYTSLYTPEIITKKEEKKEVKATSNIQSNPVNTVVNIDNKQLKDTINYIQENHLDITEPYDVWFNIAEAFNKEFGEEGRQLFHIISSQSPKYEKERADREYNNAKDYKDVNINTFYYHFFNEKNKNLS